MKNKQKTREHIWSSGFLFKIGLKPLPNYRSFFPTYCCIYNIAFYSTSTYWRKKIALEWEIPIKGSHSKLKTVLFSFLSIPSSFICELYSSKCVYLFMKETFVRQRILSLHFMQKKRGINFSVIMHFHLHIYLKLIFKAYISTCKGLEMEFALLCHN